MVQKIMDILRSENSYSVEELASLLNVDEISLRKILDEMCDELLIYKNKKKKYIIFEKSNLHKGIISISSKGYGFVNFYGKDDAFISVENLNGAKDGDIVAIEFINNSKHNLEAKVVKVVSCKKFVGTIVSKNHHKYVVLDGKNNEEIIIKDDVNLLDGMKVVVSITQSCNGHVKKVKLEEIIGHKDDPRIDLISILKSHNIENEFSKEILDYASKLPSEITDDEIENILKLGRKDLRKERVFTIDGDDTKDIDDALSINILPNGFYNLKVHIADVSHYVLFGSPIFNDAIYKRGTSVYMPGCNTPMLPRSLSNGICSLNPNVVRLALTFDMVFDQKGNNIQFNVYESIIESKKQMTYKNVNKIIEEDIIPDGYEEFKDDLLTMNKLSKLIRNRKVKRGFIEFDIDENKIYVDENGKPYEVLLYPRMSAEKMIEDFMVETGELTSEFLDNSSIDKHVYRVHDKPKEEKILKLELFLNTLGYDLKKYDLSSSKDLQLLLNSLKDKKEYLVLARVILRCMKQARYSANNCGHFALSSVSDCQVTSPIRRAGDLVNHILIKDAIYHKKCTFTNSELEKISQIASMTEQKAEMCEREAIDMKAAEYMQRYIGEEFDGIISGFSKSGIIVELPNLIKGVVRIDSLKDDIYSYDNEKYMLIGKRTNHKYRLGDSLHLKVIYASKEDKNIFFEISGMQKPKIKKRI